MNENIIMDSTVGDITFNKRGSWYDYLKFEGYTTVQRVFNMFIKDEDLEKHFEKAYHHIETIGMDAGSVKILDNTVLSFGSCFVYKCKNLDAYIKVYETDKQENSKIISIVYYKTDNKINEIVEFLNNVVYYYIKKPESKVAIIIKTSDGFDTQDFELKPFNINVNTMYNDDFKPVYERIVNDLTNKDKGIVLLHGDPGTGKTNLIKHLTKVVPAKSFIYVPTNLIHYLTDPSFIELLVYNKNSILILEDCENYIKDRKLNPNDAVSTILNLTDGIMSDVLNIQVICTFNGKIDAIDKALLRKGRLIAEYKFNPLEEEKAAELCNTLNIALPTDHTLASIFNANEEEFVSFKEVKQVGYGR